MVVLGKQDNYKKQNGKDQKTNISFDEIYRKDFQNNVIDCKKHGVLCTVFTEYVNNNSFPEINHRRKLKFFQ